MTDRKRPGVAFWATMVLAAALVYPLSFGPACWICVQARSGGNALHRVYRPIIWLGSLTQEERERPGPVPKMIAWYANLCAPRDIDLFMGDGEIWAHTGKYGGSYNWKL